MAGVVLLEVVVLPAGVQVATAVEHRVLVQVRDQAFCLLLNT